MRLRAQARWWTALAVVGVPVLAAPASSAQAQGFGLNEIGSCAIGRGFAVTGAPCEDASSIYWNPAATTRLPGLSVYGGVTAVQVKGSFTQDVTGRKHESDVPVEYPPFLGINWKGKGTGAMGRLALGVAGYVPYGLTSQWRDDFPGRFSALRASLQSIYVQPNVAFALVPGRVSIGGGPVFVHSTLELRSALDFAALPTGQGVTFGQIGFAPGTEFGRLTVKGDGTGTGFNVGLHAQLAPSLSVGARYLSKVRVKYEDAPATFTQSASASTYVLPQQNPLGVPAGTTLTQLTAPQFTGTGAFRSGQKANTQIDHPAQFEIGVGYTGLANTTLSADYALIQWTSFKELPIDFGTGSALTRSLIEDYENTNAVRVGAEHRYKSGVAARAGFSFATTPAPDVTVTPLLPDMDRYNFNLGAAVPLTRNLVLDAGYLRVETTGRRGRTGERASRALTATQVNNGWYALNANILSLSLKAQF